MKATYWSVSVNVDRACKVSFSKPTLPAAISEGVADAIYYRSVYPNEPITVGLCEECATCFALGYVARKGQPMKSKQCPDCLGKRTGQSFVVPFAEPHPSNRIKIVALASHEPEPVTA